jgi:hypothetical protein
MVFAWHCQATKANKQVMNQWKRPTGIVLGFINGLAILVGADSTDLIRQMQSIYGFLMIGRVRMDV